MLLLLKILAPQLTALLVYALVRALRPRRDPGLAQIAAICITGLCAAGLGAGLVLVRQLAFVALEIFVSLLAQLLIIAAGTENQ